MQECLWILQGHEVSACSRKFVTLNVSPPQCASRVLCNAAELAAMEDDATEVQTLNALIKAYSIVHFYPLVNLFATIPGAHGHCRTTVHQYRVFVSAWFQKPHQVITAGECMWRQL